MTLFFAHPIFVKRVIYLILIAAMAAGCNMPATPVSGTPSPGDSASTPLPPAPETLVSFRVLAPANTPPDTQIFLTILDEVTGLALNAQPIPMEVGGGAPGSTEGEPGAAPAPVFVITLPFPIGSVIQYRYERSAGEVRVAEHLSDGSAVRYRIAVVNGQMLIDDIVSRWTDTPYTLPSGRIRGEAFDSASGAPIPSLLISAGGAQTITAADGSFVLEGLPPGVHNLVAYAMDGAYHPFQQGARVAAQSTTPTPLELSASSFTNVVFVVRVPEGTFPVIPVRVAGNLYQMGNTFANLALGAGTLPANMPQMEALPDGRYRLTLSLPVGAEIRYKYTLGDGFWNAERNSDGTLRLRSFVVPETTLMIEDSVDTWSDAGERRITFDLHVPESTPQDDFVSVQFDPLIGWTEPLPMWNLGDGRWAYVLYSPLNLPGDLKYRYCRNGQCESAGDADGERTAQIGEAPVTKNDTISAWRGWNGPLEANQPAVEATPRDTEFVAGIEVLQAAHPSWQALFGRTVAEIQAAHANTVVLRPTWSFGRFQPGNTPPLLSSQPERDLSWFALTQMVEQAQASGLDTALYPSANFLMRWDQWWSSAPRSDPGWWPTWFDQYRRFVLHHADLAAQTGSKGLILGGDWLAPALPGGTLTDGQPSGVPDDAEDAWRGLIGEVRSRYDGPLFWATPAYMLENPPVFLDEFDGVYLNVDVPAGQSFEQVLGYDLASWLDNTVLPFQFNTEKEILLGLELDSGSDVQAQVDLYSQALQATETRTWIAGFVARGYYPPAAVQEASPSIHGKPAAATLEAWFEAWLAP